MYGFPEDLDLTGFIGECCTEVGVGQHDLALRFEGSGTIQFNGPYRLVDETGAVIEAGNTDDTVVPSRDGIRLPLLLGVPMTGFHVQSRHTLTLRFENGCTLSIDDDSEQYETASIRWEDGREVYI